MCKNNQSVQAILDAHLRNNGAIERDCDYSMIMLERVDQEELLTLEQYIDYYK